MKRTRKEVQAMPVPTMPDKFYTAISPVLLRSNFSKIGKAVSGWFKSILEKIKGERLIILKVLKIIVVAMVLFFFCYQVNDLIVESRLKNYYQEKYQQKYIWLSFDLYKKIRIETTRKGVPTNWMLALYDAESQGNRYAVSVSGAKGFGQVMPIHLPDNLKNHQEVLFDVDFNVALSTRIFKDCLIKNNGDLVKALNAYERGNKRQDINVNYLAKIVKNIGVIKEN